MQTSRFKLAIISIVSFLVLFIISLSAALYVQGPRVRLVAFEKDVSKSALYIDSTVTINFDRPIKQQDYTEQVSFSPAVQFEARTTAQSIIVTLKENFIHETNYSLRVTEEVYDKTGRKMDAPYVHTFKTSAPRYVYIERNYPQEVPDASYTDPIEPDDHLKMVSADGATTMLFSAPQISMFGANSDYAVVSVREQDQDKLFSVDLETGEIREKTLLYDGRINNLVVSPRGSIALLTLTPDYQSVSSEYYDEYTQRVEALDLTTGKMTSLVDGAGTFIKAYSIQIDPYGQTAIIQDETQNFYAASPYNDFDPVLLGSNSLSYGFNDTASEIIFRDKNGFSLYEIESGELTPKKFETTNFIKDITLSGDDYYYSSINYLPNEARSYVEKLAEWEDSSAEILWSSREYKSTDLRDFSLSYDNAILALQLNPSSCRYDFINTNSQCTEAETVLYDHRNEQEITKFRGFGIVWLP